MSVIIDAKDLTKRFGSFVANDHVNFTLQSGEVHAIAGENGAGKSTLLKMLFGLYQPTSGRISIRGQSIRWKNPRDAMKHGLGMVHQHFCLVDSLSAIDNIILGSEPCQFGGRLNREQAIHELEQKLPSPHLKVPWNKKVQDLSVGYRQRIEILKLFYRNAEVLFLDEPTAVLTPHEIEDFLELVVQMKNAGKTIVFISHKLKEIFRVCDSFTVLRQGRVTGSGKIKEIKENDMVRMIIGEKDVPLAEERKVPSAEAALELKGVSSGLLKDASFKVNCGEILGIAGVEGSGQREVFESILDICKYQGEIFFFGKNADDIGTRERRSLGVGVVPEERLTEGLWGDESCFHNMIIGIEENYAPSGFLNEQTIEKTTEVWGRKFDVRAANYHTPSKLLSGGNQQKLIFAREILGRKPKLMICYQPTRGVDLAASAFLRNELVRLRNEGVSVLVISADLDELFLLSDRICVFFDGKSVKTFERTEFDAFKVGSAMTGTIA